MWNIDSALAYTIWPESADMDVNTFTALMEASNELCAAYAPTLPVAAPIPTSWLLAEIFQARHIWSQIHGGNQSELGPDGYNIPVYPLVFAARDLLRPKSSPLGRLR